MKSFLAKHWINILVIAASFAYALATLWGLINDNTIAMLAVVIIGAIGLVYIGIVMILLAIGYANGWD